MLEGFDSGSITVGGIPLEVAVARTPQQQAQGLMNVSDLPEGTGMLFVFPEEKMGSFWMKDTLIPLDIAFFNTNRRLDLSPWSRAPQIHVPPIARVKLSNSQWKPTRVSSPVWLRLPGSD